MEKESGLASGYISHFTPTALEKLGEVNLTWFDDLTEKQCLREDPNRRSHQTTAGSKENSNRLRKVKSEPDDRPECDGCDVRTITKTELDEHKLNPLSLKSTRTSATSSPRSALIAASYNNIKTSTPGNVTIDPATPGPAGTTPAGQHPGNRLDESVAACTPILDTPPIRQTSQGKKHYSIPEGQCTETIHHTPQFTTPIFSPWPTKTEDRASSILPRDLSGDLDHMLDKILDSDSINNYSRQSITDSESLTEASESVPYTSEQSQQAADVHKGLSKLLMLKTPGSLRSRSGRERELRRALGISLNGSGMSWTSSLATPSSVDKRLGGCSSLKNKVSVEKQEFTLGAARKLFSPENNNTDIEDTALDTTDDELAVESPMRKQNSEESTEIGLQTKSVNISPICIEHQEISCKRTHRTKKADTTLEDPPHHVSGENVGVHLENESRKRDTVVSHNISINLLGDIFDTPPSRASLRKPAPKKRPKRKRYSVPCAIERKLCEDPLVDQSPDRTLNLSPEGASAQNLSVGFVPRLGDLDMTMSAVSSNLKLDDTNTERTVSQHLQSEGMEDGDKGYIISKEAGFQSSGFDITEKTCIHETKGKMPEQCPDYDMVFTQMSQTALNAIYEAVNETEGQDICASNFVDDKKQKVNCNEVHKEIEGLVDEDSAGKQHCSEIIGNDANEMRNYIANKEHTESLHRERATDDLFSQMSPNSIKLLITETDHMEKTNEPLSVVDNGQSKTESSENTLISNCSNPSECKSPNTSDEKFKGPSSKTNEEFKLVPKTSKSGGYSRKKKTFFYPTTSQISSVCPKKVFDFQPEILKDVSQNDSNLASIVSPHENKKDASSSSIVAMTYEPKLTWNKRRTNLEFTRLSSYKEDSMELTALTHLPDTKDTNLERHMEEKHTKFQPLPECREEHIKLESSTEFTRQCTKDNSRGTIELDISYKKPDASGILGKTRNRCSSPGLDEGIGDEFSANHSSLESHRRQLGDDITSAKTGIIDKRDDLIEMYDIGKWFEEDMDQSALPKLPKADKTIAMDDESHVSEHQSMRDKVAAETPMVAPGFQAASGKGIVVSEKDSAKYAGWFEEASKVKICQPSDMKGTTSGFQTASGKEVEISTKDSAKYASWFEEDSSRQPNVKNGQAPDMKGTTSGFQTASGKEVEISTKDSAKYASWFEEDSSKQPNVKNGQASDMKGTTTGFQTASGKEVEISTKDSAKYASWFEEDSSKQPNVKNGQAPDMKGTTSGFQTASGTEVEISTKDSAKYASWFEEDSSRQPNVKNSQAPDMKKTTSGFQTASGKEVEIPSKDSAKYASWFEEDSSKQPNVKNDQAFDMKGTTSGFQTASGKEVEISTKDSAKYASWFEEDSSKQPNVKSGQASDIIRPTSGFQTARGKEVEISTKDSAKYASWFEEDSSRQPNVKNGQAPDMKGTTSGFQTASGKEVEISTKDSAKYASWFEEDSSKQPNVKNGQAFDMKETTSGFQTASGKEVEISTKDSAKYASWFEEDSSRQPNVKNGQAADMKKTTSGFQTASGKEVEISTKESAKYASWFEEDSSKQPNVKNDQAFDMKGTTSGFQTASGKEVEISTKDSAKYASWFEEDSSKQPNVKSGQASDIIRPTSGFQTANGKGIKISTKDSAKYASWLEENCLEQNKLKDDMETECALVADLEPEEQVGNVERATEAPPMNYGFQTAGGSKISIDLKDMTKYTNWFEEDVTKQTSRGEVIGNTSLSTTGASHNEGANVPSQTSGMSDIFGSSVKSLKKANTDIKKKDYSKLPKGFRPFKKPRMVEKSNEHETKENGQPTVVLPKDARNEMTELDQSKEREGEISNPELGNIQIDVAKNTELLNGNTEHLDDSFNNFTFTQITEMTDCAAAFLATEEETSFSQYHTEDEPSRSVLEVEYEMPREALSDRADHSVRTMNANSTSLVKIKHMAPEVVLQIRDEPSSTINPASDQPSRFSLKDSNLSNPKESTNQTNNSTSHSADDFQEESTSGASLASEVTNRNAFTDESGLGNSLSAQSVGFQTASGREVMLCDESAKHAREERLNRNEKEDILPVHQIRSVPKGLHSRPDNSATTVSAEDTDTQTVPQQELAGTIPIASTAESASQELAEKSIAKGNVNSVSPCGDAIVPEIQTVNRDTGMKSDILLKDCELRSFSTNLFKVTKGPLSNSESSHQKKESAVNEIEIVKPYTVDCAKFVRDTSSHIESQKPKGFCGFQTARGNSVNVSRDALKKAKNLLDDKEHCEPRGDNLQTFPNGESYLTNKSGKAEISQSTPFLGFETASGSKVQISENALKQVKHLFVDEQSDIEDCLPHAKGQKAAIQSFDDSKEPKVKQQKGSFMGFETARGTKVSVSKSALDHVQCLHQLEQSDHSADENQNQIRKNRSCKKTLGFETAAVSRFTASETALNHVQVLQENSMENTSPEKSFSKPVVFQGFETASGSKVTISGDSLKKARDMLDESNLLKMANDSNENTKYEAIGKTPNTERVEILKCQKRNEPVLTNRVDSPCKNKIFAETGGQPKLATSTPDSGRMNTSGRVYQHKGQSRQDRNDAERRDRKKPVTSTPEGFLTDRCTMRQSLTHQPLISAPEKEVREHGQTNVGGFRWNGPTSYKEISTSIDDIDINKSEQPSMKNLQNDLFTPKKNTKGETTFVTPYRNQVSIPKQARAFETTVKSSTVTQGRGTTDVHPCSFRTPVRTTTVSKRTVSEAEFNTPNSKKQKVEVPCGGAENDANGNKDVPSRDLSEDWGDEQDSLNSALAMADLELLEAETHSSNSSLREEFKPRKVSDEITKRRMKAKVQQAQRIKKKKDTGGVRPLAGSWYKLRCEKLPLPLRAAVRGWTPQSYSHQQLHAFGVRESTWKVKSTCAESFRFWAGDFFGEKITQESESVRVGDGAVLIWDDCSTAGKEEFCNALLDLETVDPKLIDRECIYNHYKWIVWKLAAMEVSFPEVFGGRKLTPDQLMLQLKYRYDREVDNSQRSAVKKIFERDDTPAKAMILCVSQVISLPGQALGVTAHNQTPSSTGDGKDKAPPKQTAVLELTDGWYPIRAVLDPALTRLVAAGRLRPGDKVCMYGAELVGSQDAAPPLQAPADTMLKVSTNSCRRARWDARLGFHSNPQPPPLPLCSLYPDGGQVCSVDVVVARVYPQQYMERMPGGSTVFRSSRAEQKVGRRYEDERQRLMEKIYSKLQAEFEARASAPERRRSRRSGRHFTPADVAAMTCGQDIDEATHAASDPAAVECLLSSHQMAQLTDFRRMQQEELHREMEAEFRSRVESLEEEKPKRNVVALVKIRLAGCSTKDIDTKTDAVMTIWRPSTDVLETLMEGKRFKIYNLGAAESRGRLAGGSVSLTAQRSTRYQPVPVDSNFLDVIYEPRDAVLFTELTPDFSPPYGEVDLIGVVVHVSATTSFDRASGDEGQVQTVYVADHDHNLVALTVWGSVAAFDLEDILKPSTMLACANLLWRPNARGHLPALTLTEATLVSTNPKEPHLRAALDQLKSNLKMVYAYVEEMKEQLHGHMTTPRRPDTTPQVQRMSSGRTPLTTPSFSSRGREQSHRTPAYRSAGPRAPPGSGGSKDNKTAVCQRPTGPPRTQDGINDQGKSEQGKQERTPQMGAGWALPYDKTQSSLRRTKEADTLEVPGSAGGDGDDYDPIVAKKRALQKQKARRLSLYADDTPVTPLSSSVSAKARKAFKMPSSVKQSASPALQYGPGSKKASSSTMKPASIGREGSGEEKLGRRLSFEEEAEPRSKMTIDEKELAKQKPSTKSGDGPHTTDRSGMSMGLNCTQGEKADKDLPSWGEPEKVSSSSLDCQSVADETTPETCDNDCENANKLSGKGLPEVKTKTKGRGKRHLSDDGEQTQPTKRSVSLGPSRRKMNSKK